jgi:hypothetical protein
MNALTQSLTMIAENWLQHEADLLASEGQEAVDAQNAARRVHCITQTTFFGGTFKNFHQLLDDKIEELRT